MKNYSTQLNAVLLCLLSLASIHAFADVTGKVVGVTDGDTLTVLDSSRTQYKVRLAGIDAPEKKQPFGQASKQSLSDCAYDKTVTIVGDKQDRYGRLLGKVMVGDVDCNLRQINLGLAWHYKKYMKEQAEDDRVSYSRAEVAARSNKIGLWVDANAIAPWDWRKK